MISSSAKEYYSCQDLHNKTGIAIKTWQEHALKGRVPGQIKIGKCWRFKMETIDEAFSRHEFLNPDLTSYAV